METFDQEELFKELFYSCNDLICLHYKNKKDESRDIIGHIINKQLKCLQYDIQNLSFKEFYNKYLQNTLFYNADDFTNSEIETIINESKLSDRDKRLAHMYWVDQKTEESISDELMIDRKTVRANIPKISIMLKETCAKIFK